MKIKRSTLVPILLIIYLGVMVYLGWPDYKRGATSPALYFGGTAFTLGVIVLLHFNLKKRDALRRRRQAEADDIERNKKENTTTDNANDTPDTK